MHPSILLANGNAAHMSLDEVDLVLSMVSEKQRAALHKDPSKVNSVLTREQKMQIGFALLLHRAERVPDLVRRVEDLESKVSDLEKVYK